MKTLLKAILIASGIYLGIFAGYQWVAYCFQFGPIWGFALLISPMVLVASLGIASESNQNK